MRRAIKRGIIVGFGVIFQILLSVTVLVMFGQRIAAVEIFYSILSIFLVLGIIKESKSLSKDLPWIIIIMIFPIVGALLFIVIGNNFHNSKILKSINKHEEIGKKYLIQDKKIKDEIYGKEYGKLKYIMDYVGYPVSKNNDIKYYSYSHELLSALLKVGANSSTQINIKFSKTYSSLSRNATTIVFSDVILQNDNKKEIKIEI